MPKLCSFINSGVIKPTFCRISSKFCFTPSVSFLSTALRRSSFKGIKILSQSVARFSFGSSFLIFGVVEVSKVSTSSSGLVPCNVSPFLGSSFFTLIVFISSVLGGLCLPKPFFRLIDFFDFFFDFGASSTPLASLSLINESSGSPSPKFSISESCIATSCSPSFTITGSVFWRFDLGVFFLPCSSSFEMPDDFSFFRFLFTFFV
mmetsp:Transcript_9511/g.11114  ORF Transcript_9511/g.11114 Transcript_9511/m.11114 type:complete len:205 (-) Transcript_9511:1066-1680(-)